MWDGAGHADLHPARLLPPSPDRQRAMAKQCRGRRAEIIGDASVSWSEVCDGCPCFGPWACPVPTDAMVQARMQERERAAKVKRRLEQRRVAREQGSKA